MDTVDGYSTVRLAGSVWMSLRQINCIYVVVMQPASADIGRARADRVALHDNGDNERTNNLYVHQAHSTASVAFSDLLYRQKFDAS